MLRKTILHIICCLVATLPIKALELKSVKISDANDFMSVPVLRMGTADKIAINFDILGDSHDYLRYRLVHCNADKTSSSLLESEYLAGFNEWEIDDYAYSDNTYVHYVNYNIEVSPMNHPFRHSGEYLLEIYPENDPDNIILKLPFSVSENLVNIAGYADGKTDKGFNTEYQQLDLNLDLQNLKGINPYQDLKVSVVQNNNSNATKVVNAPMRVEGDRIIYSHQPELIFDAGNEYRRFETVRTDYQGLQVDSVKFDDGIWHAWLKEDSPRNDSEYVYDSTQHGRFMIDDYNSTDPNLGADYVMVHFSLDFPEQRYNDVYLDGEFTRFMPDAIRKMKYNRRSGRYETSILLKQGSYNYQYILKDKTNGNVSSNPIEGNKYETRNEYLVRVYLREPGSRADRLVGHKVIQVN